MATNGESSEHRKSFGAASSENRKSFGTASTENRKSSGAVSSDNRKSSGVVYSEDSDNRKSSAADADRRKSSAAVPSENRKSSTPVPVNRKSCGAVLHRLSEKVSSDKDFFGRCGSQLDNLRTFTDDKGNIINAYPVIVDLRRLVQLGSTECVIQGISNQELLHAVVGLYDVSLSDMTPDVLYSTVCEKWARTIVMVRDLAETVEMLNNQPIDASIGENTSSAIFDVETNNEGVPEIKSDRATNTVVEATIPEVLPERISDINVVPSSQPSSRKNSGSNPEIAGSPILISPIVGSPIGSPMMGSPLVGSPLGSPLAGSPIQSTQEILTYVKNKRDKMAAINKDTDTYEGEEITGSIFEDVYSDAGDDGDEDEDDEESEDEDFSKGIGAFIKQVSERKECRKSHGIPVEERHVGVESRLLACATFEKKYVRHTDRVVHLTLISVRPRFRGFGLGKYLLSHIVDTSVVGLYEAIVVHADNSAIEFFQKYGFTDDLILNSRWSELAEQFTNCTIMCFLPGFSGAKLTNINKMLGAEMLELDVDFNKWKDKTLEAYQAQASCVIRMKHEVVHLKNIVKTQLDFLTKLVMENELLRKEKMMIEKDFLTYKLGEDVDDADLQATQDLIAKLQQQLEGMEGLDLNIRKNLQESNSEDGMSTEALIDSLQKQLDGMDINIRQNLQGHSLVPGPREIGRHKDRPRPNFNIFYNILDQFIQAIKADKRVVTEYTVTSVKKAVLPLEVTDAYQDFQKNLSDASMVTDMYLCATLERPEAIDEILSSGFSEKNFTYGEFGRGLYFSKYPSRAGQFSAVGKLLLVEVSLGKVETVMKESQSRHRCSEGYDSIITPGRTRSAEDTEPTISQEYIIFNPIQVLPICLLKYKPIR